MNVFRKIVGIALVVIGVSCLLYPDAKELVQEKETEEYVEQFKSDHGPDTGTADDGEKSADTDEGNKSAGDGEAATGKDGDPLYQEIAAYNQSLSESGQDSFTDAWNYKQLPTTLDNLTDEKFGYIEIPAMDLTLPLYLGATTSNLKKGAAVLGETSIPVGGESTNAVIAGHRGYKGIKFFREIEKLEVGDAVYITNQWETLSYRVESIDIIQPNDSEAIKIQEGRDMVTLITCHPYRSHGKYRYAVYCVRDESLARSDDETGNAPILGDILDAFTAQKEVVTTSGGIYESSLQDIGREKLLRRGGACLVVVMGIISFAVSHRRKKKEKEREENREPPFFSA